MKDTIFLIPARGGSKGLPGKNIKLLNNKPLICYSIDYARKFTSDSNIFITTDDQEIANIVKKYGKTEVINRPEYLSTDTASTIDVIKHSIKTFEKMNLTFSKLVLLQPTSPFRNVLHLKEMLKMYRDEIDLITTVTPIKENPYFNIYEENENGFMEISKKGGGTRRQDCPKAFKINGNLYLFNIKSLKNISHLNELEKIMKYEIKDSKYLIDIDDASDWDLAESYIKQIR